MTWRDTKPLVGYGLAIAVCAVIAALDSVSIGLIGAGLSTIIFALTFLFPGSREYDDEPEEVLGRRVTGARNRCAATYGSQPCTRS